MKKIIIAIAVFFFAWTSASAQTVEERIKILEEAIKRQEQTIKEQQRLIEELKAEMVRSKSPGQQEAGELKEAVHRPGQGAPPEAPKTTVLGRAAEALFSQAGGQKKDILSYQAGGTTLRLVDISIDGLIAAGASTVRDEPLQFLQGGGHDPRKRGFTIQNVELSLRGAVDPYLNAEAHIVYFLDPITGESRVELEEAFFITQKLPYGLQLKGGHFFTEFGRVNPQHPHQWNWQDQPIINTRLFGPDGMRGPGARVGWLTPLPWFSEVLFGAQNANGETMASFLANEEFFEERPIGGRPFVNRDVRNLKDLVYLGRWNNSWDLSDEVTLVQGLSGLLGPNATGPDGKTLIYGADLKLKWRPADHQRGWPFLVFESEIMKRDYRADSFFRPGIRLAKETLRDWGLYAQLLWGFKKDWATGIRLDYVSGSGDSIDFVLGPCRIGVCAEILPRNLDPLRNDRVRLSPLLAWHPTEFARFRLQYNYDHFAKRISEFEGRNAHSVWLGVEFMLGAHAAHKY